MNAWVFIMYEWIYGALAWTFKWLLRYVILLIQAIIGNIIAFVIIAIYVEASDFCLNLREKYRNRHQQQDPESNQGEGTVQEVSV